MFDKEDGEDTLLFGCDSGGWPSPTWQKGKIMPRSRFRCYSALISYEFIAFFSNSQADFRCLFDDDLDPFP